MNGTRSLLLALFLLLTLVGACKDTEDASGASDEENTSDGSCQTRGDCRSGAVCVNNVCVEEEFHRETVVSLGLACSELVATGEFEQAIRSCDALLALVSDDALAKKHKADAQNQRELKKHYLESRDLLGKKQCDEALTALDRITDPNSWAARQALKERIRERAEKCVLKNAPDAATALDASKSGDELAFEAKKLLLSDPTRAAELYEKALAIQESAENRVGYAFALERAGEVCKAYSEYQKVVGQLTGKAQARAQKSVAALKSRCE